METFLRSDRYLVQVSLSSTVTPNNLEWGTQLIVLVDNVWDFCVHIVRISESFWQLRNFTEDDPTTCERCRGFLKMFQLFLKVAKNVMLRSSKSWRNLVSLLFRTQMGHLTPFPGLFWLEIPFNFSSYLIVNKQVVWNFASGMWNCPVWVWLMFSICRCVTHA